MSKFFKGALKEKKSNEVAQDITLFLKNIVSNGILPKVALIRPLKVMPCLSQDQMHVMEGILNEINKVIHSR